MTWWQIVVVVLVVVIFWQVIAYFAGNPSFWRLVGRNPDLALKLFRIESGCLVDTPPPNGKKTEYTGPFRVYSADGATHKIYILFKEIDVIQKHVAQALNAAEGRAPHLGIH